MDNVRRIRKQLHVMRVISVMITMIKFDSFYDTHTIHTRNRQNIWNRVSLTSDLFFIIYFFRLHPHTSRTHTLQYHKYNLIIHTYTEYSYNHGTFRIVHATIGMPLRASVYNSNNVCFCIRV